MNTPTAPTTAPQQQQSSVPNRKRKRPSQHEANTFIASRQPTQPQPRTPAATANDAAAAAPADPVAATKTPVKGAGSIKTCEDARNDTVMTTEVPPHLAHSSSSSSSSSGSSVTLTPHTLRLLQLIQRGTLEHAQLAAIQLSRITARSTSSPLVLWEIVGRLVHFLLQNDEEGDNNNIYNKYATTSKKTTENSNSWQTRYNASLALQGVAQHLPQSDQDAFLLQLDWKNPSESQEQDQSRPQPPKPQPQPDPVPSSNSKNKDFSWLTLSDLIENGQWTVILEHGRVLLAASEQTRYKNSRIPEEEDDYRDQRRIQTLDQEHHNDNGSHHDDQNDAHHRNAFVQRRIQLQRQILAQRLGLGSDIFQHVVSSTSTATRTRTNRNSVDTIISDDDLKILPTVARSSTTTERDEEESTALQKRQRYMTQIVGRPPSRPLSQESKHRNGTTNRTNNNHPPASLRALLVLEMHHQEQQHLTKTTTTTTTQTSSSSHRNPQSLLATELIYRMFDPSWQVRHGALLGILALFRAWKTTTTQQQQKQQHDDSTTAVLGAWPHDILVRCLCCLVLDRFGDYSGVTPTTTAATRLVNPTTTSGTNTNVTNPTTTISMGVGGVVAPVREMAGQVFSVVFVMAPRAIQEQALTLLCTGLLSVNRPLSTPTRGEMETTRLETCPDEFCSWEVRHGALLALKYVVAKWLEEKGDTAEDPNDNHPTKTYDAIADTSTATAASEWKCHCREWIGRVASHCLADPSDDVQSVAAQIVSRLVQQMNLSSSSFLQGTDTEDDKLLSRFATTTMVTKGQQQQQHSLMIVEEASPPLWKALQQARHFVSSCTVDLVALFTTLVSHDCNAVLQVLSTVTDHAITRTGGTVLPLILRKLVDLLLHCDYPSVQQCVLQAMGIIAGPIAAQFRSSSGSFIWADDGAADRETTSIIRQELVESLCLVMESVFDSWFRHPYEDESVPESDYADTTTKTSPKSQSSVVDNAASNMIRAARGTAWSQLIKAFATVWSINGNSNIIMMHQTTLLANLTRRYFGLNEGGNAGTMVSCGDNVVPRNRPSLLMGWRLQRRLDVAGALAEFILATASSSTCVDMLDFSLGVFLESPQASQCQTACLLYQSIWQELCDATRKSCREHQGKEKLIRMLCDFRPMIQAMLLDAPLSIQFEASQEALLRRSNDLYCKQYNNMARVCDEGFQRCLDMIQKNSTDVKVTAQALVALWKTSLRLGHGTESEQGASEPLGSALAMTPSWMRANVAIAGAIIAFGSCFGPLSLPAKLTPIVRALMTSLKNEVDESWRNLTCTNMAKLLRLLVRDDLDYPFKDFQGPCSKELQQDEEAGHERTRNKVLSSLCDFIGAGKNPANGTASQVIALLVRTGKLGTLETEMCPVWNRLHPIALLSSEQGMPSLLDASVAMGPSTDTIAPALLVLKAVCGALESQTLMTAHVIHCFLDALVLLCIRRETPQSSRNCSSDIMQLLCRVDPQTTLTNSLPRLMPFFRDQDCDLHRLEALSLLRFFLDAIGMEDIRPFVRTLLPLAMSMMTDPYEDCAKIAANMFSALVRVAPLVPKTRLSSARASSLACPAASPVASSVIDHLIHGEPLPPCEIPSSVVAALKQSGIKLRNYQIEGLSWLRFLQSVNLNGALCDSMGLGKTLQALLGVALAHDDTVNLLGGKHHQLQPESSAAISLVICPSTVVGHWMREIDRFFPNQGIFRSLLLTGTASQRLAIWTGKSSNCNIVVTSYAAIRKDIGMLKSTRFRFCILDEGHLLKNPKTGE
jgi:hypothetical protein